MSFCFCCQVASSFFSVSIEFKFLLYCSLYFAASVTLAEAIFLIKVLFSASKEDIWLCSLIILLLASCSIWFSSDRSILFSLTEVRIAHSLLWLLSEPPQSLHLYCVVPELRVVPSLQVTLIVTLSQPLSLASSVA